MSENTENTLRKGYDKYILKNGFGLCSDCNLPKTADDWCQHCNSKQFQQDFDKWTSGNEKNGFHVVLKSLNNSSNINNYFLNEVYNLYMTNFSYLFVNTN